VLPRVNINLQFLILSSQVLTISLALASAPLSVDPSFHWQEIWGEWVLSENDLTIMAMTTFKVSTAGLHLVAIACIMLVAVQVTEAARELEDGVGGVLLNREQVASVHTKAELTGFQAAACKLLRLPCAVQFSIGDDCSPNGQKCWKLEDCCSGMCIAPLIYPPVAGRCVSAEV
jgi:hypothetical protein